MFRPRSVAIVLLVLLMGLPASAAHHLMQIEQVIGSVNGNTEAQAIQLRMRSLFQNLLAGSRLYAYDAAGENPILIMDFNDAVENGAIGDRVLIATAAFNALTTPATTPDFTMANRIPDAYLAAGRLTFEEDNGEILWSLAWGGDAYTGSNLGGLDNDADGNFGPQFGQALPVSAPFPQASIGLLYQGTPIDPSTNNAADYALTAGNPTVANNSDAEFVVDGGPKSITVTRPNRDQAVPIGSRLAIRWRWTGNFAKVRIELERAGRRIAVINRQTANDGKFNWIIADVIQPADRYRVVVLEKRNRAVIDHSPAFSIVSR